jgi:NADH-quinone oxidoreductase subunit F
MTLIRDEAALDAVRSLGLAKLLPARPRIAVGMGTCGTGNGAEVIYHALSRTIEQRGLDVQLVQTGCFGFCAEEPLVNVWCPGKPLVMFRRVRTDSVDPILDVITGRAIPDSLVLCKIEHWDHITAQIDYGTGHPAVPAWDEVPFFSGQKKIVLRNCGLINPDDIEEYIGIGGYRSLYQVLRAAAPVFPPA